MNIVRQLKEVERNLLRIANGKGTKVKGKPATQAQKRR